MKKSIIDIKVLLIIPCYNEELRLKTELFIQFKKNNPNIHFLFVDDGSHDTTPDILKDLCTYRFNKIHKRKKKMKKKKK